MAEKPRTKLLKRFTYGPARRRGPTAALNFAPEVPIPPLFAHEAKLEEYGRTAHVVLCLNLTEARTSGARTLLTGCEKPAPIRLVYWTPFERRDPEIPRCEKCRARITVRRKMGALIVAPALPEIPPSRQRGRFKADPKTLKGRMERLITVLDRAEKYGFTAREPIDVFDLIVEHARTVITIFGRRYVLTMEEEIAGHNPDPNGPPLIGR